jgi:RimJ/RimL family protein N-acetyltransferase
MNKLLLNIPEVITTPRLLLQMPKAGFGEKLHEAISDGYDDYVRWLKWPEKMPTPHMVEEDCRRHQAEFILRDCLRYIIIEKNTGKVIGRCAFPPQQAHWSIPQFGIAYFIRRTARAQGYATEAAHALCLLAFNVLGAKKVEIYCDAENSASRKIPAKLGFHLEYRQKGGWLAQDGSLADLETYTIFSKHDLPYLEILW